MGAMGARVLPNRVLYAILLDDEVVSPGLASHPLKYPVTIAIRTVLLQLGFHPTYACLRTYNHPTVLTFERPET
jgi:hypothetical protein